MNIEELISQSKVYAMGKRWGYEDIILVFPS